MVIPNLRSIPQGSTLGPLLCIIYIKDFRNSSKFSILFADDTTLLLEGTLYDKLISELNSELYHVSQWLRAIKLTLNTRKYH